MTTALSLTLIVAASLAMSCQRNRIEPEYQTQISVDAAVNDTFIAEQTAATRIDATGFVDGDQISFFAVKYNGQNANQLGLDAATYLNNVLYQRDNGLFKHYDGTQYIRDFFPNDGSSIDIYGIYPRAATITEYVNYPFAVAPDQTLSADYFASDMMVAKTASIAPQAVPNRLLFHHLMAKVEVNVKLLNFPVGTDVTDVRVLNIIPDAKIDLRAFNGTSTRVDVGVQARRTILPLEVIPATAGYIRTYTALVPPQYALANSAVVEVVLNTVNKDVYTLKMADNFSLQGGKKNIFDLTVNFGSRPDIIGTGQIKGWNETTVDGGTADKESEYKYKVVLINPKDAPINTRSVKVGVNGNRTFHLTKHIKYEANAEGADAAIYFSFAGDGNRPPEADGATKFTITRLELLNAAGAKFNQCLISPPIEVTAMGEMTLYYDMTAGTITPTRP